MYPVRLRIPVARARSAPNVTLDLVNRVEAILRATQAPTTRYQLMKRLAATSHGTTRPRLNAALHHLAAHHIVHDAGEEGVVWLGRPSLRVLERLARAKVLA